MLKNPMRSRRCIGFFAKHIGWDYFTTRPSLSIRVQATQCVKHVPVPVFHRSRKMKIEGDKGKMSFKFFNLGLNLLISAKYCSLIDLIIFYLCTFASEKESRSVMYEQDIQETFFLMFYAAVAMLSLIACFYMLFCRGNAFAIDITPPARLRRWAATFFAALALCHLWYMPMYFLSSSDDVMLGYLIAGLLDCLTIIPLTIVVLITMLQDRKRPLWSVWAIMAPLVLGLAWCIVSRSDDLLPVLYAYFLLMCVGLIIYMIRAIRQYGRWLCNNYADLEHKEVWQSFVVFAIILLGYAIYLLDIGELLYEYVMEVINIVLICYLLWRVETLSDLSIAESDAEEETDTTEKVEDNDLSIRNRSTSASLLAKNIGPLLKQHCEEPQLYLQHDISAMQLAKLIGTNRLYLSKHFASQGITYSTYINGLRIQHFINLYHEAVATHQPITVRQLAHKSGFHSYSTFNAAFKQSMGMTASEWMSSES